MRTTAALLAPLALLLCACAAQAPATPPPPAAAAQAAPMTAPVISEQAVTQALNLLVNDTAPDSPEFAARRAALTPAARMPELDGDLRRVVNLALAFDPPNLRQRWQRHMEAQERVAAHYVEHPPRDTRVLEGGRVLRRLGPALYLVRLKDGETVFLAANRRHKPGARLKGVYGLERPRQKPDRSRGDLVDELADQPRTIAEITAQEARGLEGERAPVLRELQRLEAGGLEHQRAVAQDLARLDALTREVNAAVSPRLLPRAQAPAAASFIRKVARLSRTYSRGQYYRYALPVTGRGPVDAVLKGYLDERRAEVQELLRSTGIGGGRLRANTDRVAFAAFAASPRLLSIRFEAQRDTGGAHPNQNYAAFSFDMERQARLTLADIFRDLPAALAVLSELAQRRLDLALDGLLFREGLTPQAENFAVFVLDGADLVFTFPPYQAASYAQGPQQLRVPLCHPRLRPLLSSGFLEALAAR